MHDYQQVASINGGEIGRDICDRVETFELTVVHRTTDTTLLDLLSIVRCGQPSKKVLRDFFGTRLSQFFILGGVPSIMKKNKCVPK